MTSKDGKCEHPLAHYHDRITDITSRFSFTHHPVPDNDGLIATPQGFGRPFYHRATNTVGVLYSKTANNLQGRQLADGRIVAARDELERCYIFSARRARGDESEPLEQRANAHTMRRETREDFDVARRTLGVKSRKHYTLYGADNIYTNGRHMYEIIKNRKGDGYRVVLKLSTRREGGGFVPFDPNDKSLRGFFSHASKTLAKTRTHEQAREVISQHWEKLSSDLWENKNIFFENGKGMTAKKLLCDFANVAINKGPRIAWSTAIVGGIFAVKYGMALGVVGGLVAGLSSTLIHTAVHLPVEFGVDEFADAKRRSKELKGKQNIEAFGYDADVSDHFKIQTPENLAKLCPHIDLERFLAKEFEFLPLDMFDLRKDREQVQETLQSVSLAGHLMFMGQRGISSEAFIADEKSELHKFQSGVVRYMHEKPNGNVVVFAQYRPELCKNDGLRLPQEYIAQFGNNIMRMEYDRRQESFTECLVDDLAPVQYNDMVREIESEHLFTRYKDISWDTKSKTMQGIFHNFVPPQDYLYMLYQHKGALRAGMRAIDPV